MQTVPFSEVLKAVNSQDKKEDRPAVQSRPQGFFFKVGPPGAGGGRGGWVRWTPSLPGDPSGFVATFGLFFVAKRRNF